MTFVENAETGQFLFLINLIMLILCFNRLCNKSYITYLKNASDVTALNEMTSQIGAII
jgi:hypothetical protein